MRNLGYVDFLNGTEPPREKAPWGIIDRILAALVTLSTLFLAPWDKHPRLAVILVVIAVLLLVFAFAKVAMRWLYRVMARQRRNRLAHSQFSELLEFARRFGRFADACEGKNLRNILFYGVGSNQSDFATFYARDHVAELWPYFFTRLQRTRLHDEVSFCNAVRELCALVSSYNNSYVIDPLKRIDAKLWRPNPNAPMDVLVAPVAWLNSLPEHQRVSVKKQINEFIHRWARFLDDFVLFLDRIKDRFNCPRLISDNPQFSDSGTISSYFERPTPLE